MGQRIISDPLRVARKTITFDSGSGTGATGAAPIFTVTGEVLVSKIIPYITTNLAGDSATLALGVTSGTADFIAATTATDMDADEFWVDTAPDANSVALPAALQDILVTDNIIGTVATAAISGGVVDFTVYWRKISADGNVV
tara:strand:- start:211 stop:636 length:426 start_codon:yes stop_codon:yes gene_type:complete